MEKFPMSPIIQYMFYTWICIHVLYFVCDTCVKDCDSEKLSVKSLFDNVIVLHLLHRHLHATSVHAVDFFNGWYHHHRFFVHSKMLSNTFSFCVCLQLFCLDFCVGSSLWWRDMVSLEMFIFSFRAVFDKAHYRRHSSASPLTLGTPESRKISAENVHRVKITIDSLHIN